MPRKTRVSECMRVTGWSLCSPVPEEASIPSEFQPQMPTVSETDSSIRQLPALPVSD